jgi:hypothetical protein
MHSQHFAPVASHAHSGHPALGTVQTAGQRHPKPRNPHALLFPHSPKARTEKTGHMLHPRNWFKCGELPSQQLITHHSFLTSPYPHRAAHTWSLRLGVHALTNARGEQVTTNGIHLIVIPDDVRKQFMDEHPTEEPSAFYRLLHARLGQSTLPTYLHQIAVTAPLQSAHWYKDGLFITFRSAEAEFTNKHMRFIVKQNQEPFPSVITPTLRILSGDFSTTSSPAPATIGCALSFRHFDQHLFDFQTSSTNNDVRFILETALFEYSMKNVNLADLRARMVKSVRSNPNSASGMHWPRRPNPLFKVSEIGRSGAEASS